MCDYAYGLNPDNSAIYEVILNLITYLERYWNLLFKYVKYVLTG